LDGYRLLRPNVGSAGGSLAVALVLSVARDSLTNAKGGTGLVSPSPNRS